MERLFSVVLLLFCSYFHFAWTSGAYKSGFRSGFGLGFGIGSESGSELKAVVYYDHGRVYW